MVKALKWLTTFNDNHNLLPNLHYLTQTDNGWRKTVAVNRASA